MQERVAAATNRRRFEDFAADEGARLGDSRGYWGSALMWYGYAIEAIYIVLGTALIPIIVGVLIYQ